MDRWSRVAGDESLFMTDSQSEVSILSSLHDFHLPSSNDFSEISSCSSESSSDEPKTRIFTIPISEDEQQWKSTRNEERIEVISPSRLRAQRNIRQSTKQGSSAPSSTFFPIVVLRLLFFGFIYLLVGSLFYVHTEDWSLLTSLYFIFLSVCRVGLKDVAPESDGGRIFTAFYIPIGAMGFWGFPLRILFVWTRINIDHFLLPFLSFFSLPYHKLSPEGSRVIVAKAILSVLLLGGCVCFGMALICHCQSDWNHFDGVSWSLKILLALGFSPQEFPDELEHSSRSLIFTLSLAILSTTLAPSHLWAEIVSSEVVIPSEGDSNASQQPTEASLTATFVKSLTKLPALLRKSHPLSPRTVYHFQTQLRETGYVSRLEFLKAMLLETTETRPDVNIPAILQEFVDVQHPETGTVDQKGLKDLISRYELNRLATICSLEEHLCRGSSWTATATATFQNLLHSAFSCFSSSSSPSLARVPSLSPSTKQPNLKILSSCYELMKESLELADLGDTLRSESELLRLLEAYRRTPLSLESVEGTLALISVQNNLALCHYEQGRLHSAETLLRHCINQYHRSILHFTPLSLRPFLFAVHGNGDRREGRGNKSRDKGSGPLKRQYLYLLFNLANVLSRLERFEEAETLYLFCLEQIEISYFPSSGPSEDEREQEQEEGKGACHDQDHLSILSNLAILYANQRTLSSSSGDSYGFLAEKLFRECLSKRGEVLWMILADRDVYRQKIASARLREKQQRQQQQQQQWSKVRGNGKGKGRTEEDILRRDEVYSLDPEHGQGEGQRQKQGHGQGWESEESEVGSEETDDEEEKQYELLYRHSSILWLRSLFNLTCHLIETQAQTHSSGHGPHSRPLDPCPLTLEEALEECLQRSRELLHGDERKGFIERVRLLRKRLQLQVQQRQRQRRERQELRSLWGNIYSGGGERDRDGWGEVVMDAEKWFESSFYANASSASPRFPFFSLPGKDLEKEMERPQSEGNNGKEQRQEEGEEGRLGSDSESEN